MFEDPHLNQIKPSRGGPYGGLLEVGNNQTSGVQGSSSAVLRTFIVQRPGPFTSLNSASYTPSH